jgi:hypothetical protein
MARRNQTVDAPEEVFAEGGPVEESEIVNEGVEEAPAVEMTEEDRRVEARAQKLFAKWKAEEATKKGSKKPKPEKRKHDLPEGYIAPVAFRHALVEHGLAAESMSPVQIYGLVRKASSNGMPVKHFDREGNAFDEFQTHPITSETITRPGLKLDEGLEWWKNRPKHTPGQPRVKKEATDDNQVESSDDGDTFALDEAELAADEDFVEAE